MSTATFSHEQIVRHAQFTPEDRAEIQQRRRDNNRLGFAYQLAFVRLYNRFPAQQPLEISREVLTFVGIQLALATEAIEAYQRRRETVAEHQQRLREYLGLRRFGEVETTVLGDFLFAEACHLEQTGPLLVKTKEHLRELGILQPSDDTLRRLVAKQREQASQYIFTRISDDLTSEVKDKLEALLIVDEAPFSPLQVLKQPPGQASPASILRLIEKLKQIEATSILAVNLSWLNNNYQRALAHYVRRCSAARLRQLQLSRRYAVLVCFLWQTYRDTIDYIVDMHDKILTGVYSRAQEAIDEETRRRRTLLQTSLRAYRTLGAIVLDEAVSDEEIRYIFFSRVDRETVAQQLEEIGAWLNDKYSYRAFMFERRLPI